MRRYHAHARELVSSADKESQRHELETVKVVATRALPVTGSDSDTEEKKEAETDSDSDSET